MAALNRLTQRLKENFQESTRDLNLLTGSGASHTTYFDTSDDKVKEISKLLESRSDRDRLEGMKRIIAGISKGRDMEGFFAQVVKNVVAQSIEIRKLVYIYLLRFASTNSDLLLLSINTFQKDLSDPSPLIRSMSLRVLTSIRVPVIQGIVMLGLKKLVNDRNPWVRKTVAGGLAKVFEMDPSSLPQLIPILQTLLASSSPLTMGATLTAFLEMCPERLDLLHPYYRHICRLLVDADEWGQIVALNVIVTYARNMLEKPETAGDSQPSQDHLQAKDKKPANGDESEDEFEGVDTDLAMFLHLSKALFQSRNPAVILGMANAYYHLAPAGSGIVGQELLVAPLLRLAGSSSQTTTVGEEISAMTWDVIASMAEERPWLFSKQYTRFFLHSADSPAVKISKLKGLAYLVTADNATSCMREFKHYTRFPETEVAEEAVRAVGHCVRTQPEVASSGLSSLMKLLKSKRDSLVAQSVIVLKSVILSRSSSIADPSLPEPTGLVARLAKQLDSITNAKARASVFWLVGQFAASDQSPIMGLGWEGVTPWVPDVFRKGVKGFAAEATIVKLQILTLATKLVVLCPATPLLNLLSRYLFSLARYDQDYDVRDRARFLHALVRGVRHDKISSDSILKAEGDGVNGIEDEEDNLGGVVLRREQVKVVLLTPRESVAIGSSTAARSEFDVCSMSRIVSRRLTNYTAIPEWTDDSTDSTLRDSELDNPISTKPTPSAISSAPAFSSAAIHGGGIPTPIPTHLSAASLPSRGGFAASPAGSSPAGSIPAGKGKFQDLDAFLNSESEEDSEDETEDDSEEEKPHIRAAAQVTAPPRGLIVPEYDMSESESDSEEEEDEEEDEDEEEEDEEGEARPLYGTYRS